MPEILVVGLGGLPEGLPEGICENLKSRTGQPVLFRGDLTLPHEAFRKVRGQYVSSQIVQVIGARRGLDDGTVVILCSADIFMPGSNFVFGQAQHNGRLVIVNVHRMLEATYGRVSSPVIELRRVLKEALHGLGHTVGLPHCVLRECLMHSAASVAAIDRRADEFCVNCRRRCEGWLRLK